MISTTKYYSALKDSGVPWLGEVPEHWEVEPALAVYKPRLVKNTGMVEKTVLSLSYGRIIVKPSEKLHGLVPESFETYQVVDPGNIIVRTTDLQNDKTSLRIGHAKDRGIITSAYMCLETTDRVSNDFGYQFLNAYDLLKVIYGFGSGLRQNLDFSHIKRMPVLVPPHSEQAAIVRFLDHADRRIRRYIRAKQKLIKLLEEQKQAVIHRAVTRGLDPNVRLKPSGVEWLGEVPEHWSIAPIRQLAARTKSSFVNGPFGSDLLTSELTSSGVPVIYIRDISKGEYRRVSSAHVPPAKASTLKFCNVASGDVLIAKVGDPPGTAAVYPGGEPDGIVTQDVIRIRPDLARVLPEFLVLYLNSALGRAAVGPIVVESTRGRFSLPDFKAVKVFLPPRDEQEQIVAQTAGNTEGIFSAINKAGHEISLLREYRTRLIADVVTGKLDVREAAARLPNGTEEVDEEAEGLEKDAVTGEGAEGVDAGE